MNPELTYTLELARALNRTIDGVSAMQERVGSDLAFDRSLKRGREAIISMLHKACKELAPIRDETLPDGGGEIAEFIRALEYGELPAPKATTDSTDGFEQKVAKKAKVRTPKKRSVLKRPALLPSLSSVETPLPSEAKSREVMSQWK